MTRREQRNNIFRILFKVEFNSIDEMDEQIGYSMDALIGINEHDRTYIVDKTKKIIELITDIDEIISSVSSGWNIDRIGKAELAILRLGIYEIKYDEEIPYKVAINEAVELAGTYCGDDAKSFVNALLAKVEQ
ncbi:MAG: transcription antitermination factor NusB [Clostridium sp.]|nr:transcription antitermination factor NusB [Clostridium sp.]MCM1399427.1 transcription antitermination factor NusB [Clostridium sp.]MCM1459981.1 transcription antitermination factor NusB [Bacteroides sp.]